MPQILWHRPRTRIEWGFTAVLGLMLCWSVFWLVSHGGAEDREALSQWFAVMGGETSLKLKTLTYARGGLMLTSWIWLSVSVVLWLSRSWWWKKRPTSQSIHERPIIDRQFAIGIGLILLLAIGIRWPRMDLGLYNDEIDVFRTAIEGSFDGKALQDPANDGLPKYRHVPWIEAVWGNRIGNNHALQSILARTGYEIWHWMSGAPDSTIKEWPLRLPSLFGGLLSIAVIAVLAKLATGSARAGFFAAFFLAVHPWHLRFSTEARGYALLFGFGALTVLCLAIAVQRGQWRWWLGFGASQAAALWSCLGGLHLILAINLIAGAFFLWPRRIDSGETRLNPLQSATLPCWIVANLLSAAFFFLAVAPILPPLRLALETNGTFQQGVVPDWWRDSLTYCLMGMPWIDGAPDSSIYPAMQKYAGNIFVMGGFLLAVALAITGAWRLLRRCGFVGALAAGAPILAIVMLWLFSKFGGATLLKWYGSYATIFVGLWMGVGLSAWIFRSRDDAEERSHDRLSWQRLATYGLLGLYAIGVARPLIIYRRHSKQAMREAIELVRGGVYPFTEEQRKPLVAGWWTHANFYDPYLRIAHTPENLQLMIDRSHREQRPLFYILGMHEIAKAEDPRIVARLDNSGEFSLETVLYGLEEAQFRTWIYRYQGPKTE